MGLRTSRSSRRTRRIALVAGSAITAMATAACGGGSAGSPPDDGKIKVVASTSVWGSVVEAVGGDHVEVTSIISSPSGDPHSFEATPRDAATINEADLVVYNGGGYDEFMAEVLANGQRKPTVQAVEAAPGEGHSEEGHSGEGHSGEGHGAHEPGHEQGGHDHAVNEHVWYDTHAVNEAATRIADELARLQPANSARFRDAGAKFSNEIAGLEQRVEQIAAQHGGAKIIATEPIAHYLIEHAKLTDITPASFVDAVESENDPPASAVAEVQNAVKSRQAVALIYNPQTESPVTKDLRELAEGSGIPVVKMTETLPAPVSYTQWMSTQIDQLDQALSGAKP